MNHNFDKCSDGNQSEDDYLLRVRNNIFEYGLHIVGVVGDPVPWTYTVGLAEHGLPELVVTDVPYECASTLLNSISSQMIGGSDPGALASEIDCRLGPVHQNHIANSDLLASWVGYYHSTWCPAVPANPRFRQLVLGQSQFCVGKVKDQTDLGQPLVQMLRRACRILKRPAA